MGAFRRHAALPLLLVAIFVVSFVALARPRQAEAQCGSSASSCKNCHEVQGEYPVNTSGEWHISHAFGDFCEFCHAGNVQATEKDAAHTGMVYPLDDVNASCLSCHPNDTQEKAEVYAVALGVTVGTGSGGSSAGGSNASPNDAPSPDSGQEPPAAPEEQTATDAAVSETDGAIVDFNSQYERSVLGERPPLNVGNLILALLLVALTALGAFLVWKWEGLDRRWRALRGQSQMVAAPAYASGGAGVAAMPRLAGEVPAMRRQATSTVHDVATTPEVAAMLQRLDAPTLQALQSLLADQKAGSAVIQALAGLDPRLVQIVARLDAQERTLLMALGSAIHDGRAED